MSRSALTSAVLSYNAKLWVAGFIAAVFVPLSLGALVLDLVLRTDDPLSSRVLSASARLEAMLDIHGDLTDVQVMETA